MTYLIVVQREEVTITISGITITAFDRASSFVPRRESKLKESESRRTRVN